MRLRICGEQVRGWPSATLDSLCERITSGGTPKRGTEGYYTAEGVPWVKTQEIQDGFIYDTEEHITDLALQESSAKLLPAGTLLVAMYAAPTAGRLAILGRPMACNQAACALIPKDDLLDTRYLYYQLMNARPDLHQLANGAAQQNLSQRVIKEIEITLPPLETQHRIAQVLGDLDDLIDLDQRLVLAARDHAATIFSCMGPSTVITLGQIAELRRNGVRPSEMGQEEPFLGLEDFAVNGGGVTSIGAVSGVTSAGSRFEEGDVLFGKLRPYFRKVDRVGFSGICTNEAWVIRPRAPYSASFVYSVVESQEFVDWCMAGAGGTRMPRANWEHACSFPVKVPLRGNWDEKAEASSEELWRAVWSLREEQAMLKRVRDELLPLLMSGRVVPGEVA